MKAALPLLLLSGLLLLPQPADAQNRYESCMQAVQTQPEEGLAQATAWHEETGSMAARHCAASALGALGRFDEAAAHQRAVADAVDEQSRPSVLAELGWLWMLAGEPEQDVELRIDRAIARAELSRWWDAIDDLNRVHEAAPERTDALVLRAEAYRRVEAPELALDDLERVLALEPENAEALMQRGLVRFEQGDPDAAAFANSRNGTTPKTVLTEIGAVDLDVVGEFTRISAVTSAGQVRLRVPDEAYRVDADTSAGDITTNVATDPDADREIYARSSAGSITIDRRSGG